MPNKLKDIIVFILLLAPSFLVFFYFKNKGLHIIPILIIWVVPASIGISILRTIWGDEKFTDFIFPFARKKLDKWNRYLIKFGIPISIIIAMLIGLF